MAQTPRNASRAVGGQVGEAPTADKSHIVDPNTGQRLNDRFHQLRGDTYADRAGTAFGEKLVADFLASRGAPMTAQNAAIAREYLSGGGLARLQQQQSTEASIADAAIAAESAPSANGPPSVQGQPSVSPNTGVPMNDPAPQRVQQPTQPNAPSTDTIDERDADGEDASSDDGGIPTWLRALLPGALIAAGARVDPNVPATVQGAPKGIDGEIVNDVAPYRTVDGPPTSAVPGAAIDDVTVTANPPRTDNALPAPNAAHAIGSDNAVYGGGGAAVDTSQYAQDFSADRPITTEELINEPRVERAVPQTGQELVDALTRATQTPDTAIEIAPGKTIRFDSSTQQLMVPDPRTGEFVSIGNNASDALHGLRRVFRGL